MQRLYVPRQIVPGEVLWSYAQAYDEPKDAEWLRQIGMTSHSSDYVPPVI